MTLPENQLTLPNGNLRYFETYAYPVFDINNQVSYAVETTIDITEQKKSTKKIQQLLAEKEILLKEVHLRVKNNMSTLNSLLILQG